MWLTLCQARTSVSAPGSCWPRQGVTAGGDTRAASAVMPRRTREYSEMREKLNAIIAESEADRGLAMPRIGVGHAGLPGGIFSLLQDPGGTVHTPGSGAVVSGCVDVYNNDGTAIWIRAMLQRQGIPKSAVSPWNAFGAYGERPCAKAIRENLPLCQQLLDTALPVAVIAQGRWAQKIADRLRFSGPIFRVPHPSRRGRGSYSGASKDIEDAFLLASRMMWAVTRTPVCGCRWQSRRRHSSAHAAARKAGDEAAQRWVRK